VKDPNEWAGLLRDPHQDERVEQVRLVKEKVESLKKCLDDISGVL